MFIGGGGGDIRVRGGGGVVWEPRGNGWEEFGHVVMSNDDAMNSLS